MNARLQTRVAAGLLATGAVLTLWAGGSDPVQTEAPAPAEAPQPDRGSTEAPSTTIITEDDPRWDCRTMGNFICGDGHGNLTIWFQEGDGLAGYDVNDPHRPGCFVEPSNTPEGHETIYYAYISDRTDPLGFEVPCPGQRG